MGMFTTVRTSHGDIQFKFGGDECETVQIGQKLTRFARDTPCDDGVYDGLGGDGNHGRAFDKFWVVVKDRTPIAVVPDDGKGKRERRYRDYSWHQAQKLAEKYGVKVQP